MCVYVRVCVDVGADVEVDVSVCRFELKNKYAFAVCFSIYLKYQYLAGQLRRCLHPISRIYIAESNWRLTDIFKIA